MICLRFDLFDLVGSVFVSNFYSYNSNVEKMLKDFHFYDAMYMCSYNSGELSI